MRVTQLGRKTLRRAIRIGVPLLPLLCGSCATSQYWLLHPRGPVASASLQSWIVDTGATFLVIGPATLLVMWAMWRYRRSGGKGSYTPGWSHSLPLEATFWGAPLLVVIALGFYSVKGAFDTDPAGPGVMASSEDAKKPPVNIDVITTDWQWLFVYPDKHIAVANELVLPVHTPVRFRLTSSTVATDFFIPQLAGQIDVMPGMRTWQGLIANQIGTYDGFASDYNGPGFSWMRFQTRIVSPADFQAWEASVAKADRHMDYAEFDRFAKPTINKYDATADFSNVQDNLFEHVMHDVMMGKIYVTPANMTQKEAHKVNNGAQPTGDTSDADKDQNP